MELFSFFIFLGIILLVIKNLFSEEKKTILSQASLKIHKNGHGHRCYMEGLSEPEYRIVKLLANNLDHNEYFIFNNIILPSEFSETTQIDHIVVSKYGVFVIESKEYNGWIFAHSNRKQWTQTLPGGNKYPINNPVWQNYGHVLAIKNQLPFLGNRIFNVVVFSGNCEFKKGKPENVFYDNELIEFIKSKQDIKLKEIDLMFVIGKLSMLCQMTDITNEEHIQNIKNAFEKLKLSENKQISTI